jgi:hypothetical protein
MSKPKRTFPIVMPWPKRRERSHAPSLEDGSSDLRDLTDQGVTPQPPAVTLASPPVVAPAPDVSPMPVPGDAPAVGYVWVGRELVRIGRDDTKTFAERRSVPFGRDGG